MDMNTYDFSKLDFDELVELRALQAKMQGENGRPEDLSKLTVDEVLRLEDLHYTMAGKVNPHKPAAPHVPVVATREAPDSGVTAPVENQPVARSA